jgi:hypothetical protein
MVEGTLVVIEVDQDRLNIAPQRLPAEAIRRRALRYVLHHVGDAAAVHAPEREREGWTVRVWLPHQQRELGVLRFSEEGQLIHTASSTPEMMIEVAHAS